MPRLSRIHVLLGLVLAQWCALVSGQTAAAAAAFFPQGSGLYTLNQNAALGIYTGTGSLFLSFLPSSAFLFLFIMFPLLPFPPRLSLAILGRLLPPHTHTIPRTPTPTHTHTGYTSPQSNCATVIVVGNTVSYSYVSLGVAYAYTLAVGSGGRVAESNATAATGNWVRREGAEKEEEQ